MSDTLDREARFARAQALLDAFHSRVDPRPPSTLEECICLHPEIAAELRELSREYEGFLDDPPELARPLDTDPVEAQLRAAAGDFARYEIEAAPIARGGMGTILAVRDTSLGRELAMKVLRGAPLRGQGAAEFGRRRARFLQEARITSQLDHPGIVPVHEIGVDPSGRPYFTMKRVRGGTLAEVFDRVRSGNPHWPLARAVGVLLRVCDAVSYAHGKSVLHRDLKPSNVMVGDFGEVFVMDWGLARPERGDPASTTGEARALAHEEIGFGTLDGDVLGTPAYMAPEQAQAVQQQVGPRSDVYSIGAMLYELLAGAPPYSAEGKLPHPARVLAALRAGPPTALAKLAPVAPAELLSVCEKAMQRDAARRYADVAALGDDLRAFLEQRVVHAHASGAWIEARKWVSRNRALSAALLLAIAALVAGTITSLSYARDSLASAGRAQRGEAQALASQHRAEKITTFVEDALTSADPLRGGAQDYRVVDAMDDAVHDLATGDLKDDPETEASLQESIARILLSNGRAEQALELARSSLATRRGLLPAGHPDLVRAQSCVGRCLMNLGRNAEALPELEGVLAAREQAIPRDENEVSRSLEDLAVCLDQLGRGEEALPKYLASAEAYQRRVPGDSRDMVRHLLDIGTCLSSLGKKEEALARYQAGLQMARSLHAGNDAGVEDCLNRVAYGLEDLGRSEEALPQYQDALEMARALYPRGHPALTLAHECLAGCLMRLGHDEQALPEFQAALAAHEGQSPQGSVEEMNCLLSLDLCLDRMSKTSEALASAQRAEELGARFLPENHPLRVRCAQHLAHLRKELEAGPADPK